MRRRVSFIEINDYLTGHVYTNHTERYNKTIMADIEHNTFGVYCRCGKKTKW